MTIAEMPLLHDERRDGWRRWFDQAGLKTDAAESGTLFQDFNLLATAVITGHGIGLCPVEIIRQEIENGDLVVISDIAINHENAYFVRWHRESSPAAEAFVQWFLSAMA